MGQEEDDNQTPQLPEDDAEGPVGGERLAAARRERGISVREIAKELHLDEPKVRALEENRFEVLGAPVFVKGHMRKYAERMGIPIDDVLADYYKLNRSVGAPPVVGPPRKERHELSPGPWVVGVIIVAVAFAAWWWINRKPATGVAAPPDALMPFESHPQDDPLPEADADVPRFDQEELSESAQEPPGPGAEPDSESEPDLTLIEDGPDDPGASAGILLELELAFSGDCWTEVTDATGRRLYFDLGTEGRTVSLSGVEPFGVVLGNASNVGIRVNGLDYTVPPANRRGNTARLTIYGQ